MSTGRYFALRRDSSGNEESELGAGLKNSNWFLNQVIFVWLVVEVILLTPHLHTYLKVSPSLGYKRQSSATQSEKLP